MAYRFRLVVAAFCASAGAAHAFYMAPTPPLGFQGGAGQYTYVPSKTSDMRYGRVIFQPSALRVPVPGNPTTLPVAYRLAGNVGRIAAGVLFMNPGIRAAVGVAAWLGVGKLIWDEVDNVWREIGEKANTTGKEYQAEYWIFQSGWKTTKALACNGLVGMSAMSGPTKWTVTSSVLSGGLCVIQAKGTQSGQPTQTDDTSVSIQERNVTATACPPGWKDTPAGCLSPAVTQPQFEDMLEPQTMPDTVPWELPDGTPLPVEQPVVNPEPGADPLQRPRFVPTGDPIPNPNYDPNAAPSPENQPYIQPGIRINPSPTPDNPWRVDIQPINRPVPNSDPTVPTDEGSGQGNPGDKPKEDPPGLCEMYPDILACAKTGDLAATPVPNENRALQITPDSGYGPSNGACPPPRTAVIMGQSISMPFDLLCTFADSIRPIVIAFAWLTAALTFFGLGRKDS